MEVHTHLVDKELSSSANFSCAWATTQIAAVHHPKSVALDFP